MNICYLYTANYPYTLQITFLHSEVKILAEHFDKVIILPLNKSEIMADLPSNVEVNYLFEDLNNYRISTTKTEKLLYLTKGYFIKDFVLNLKHLLKSKKLLKDYLSQYIQDRIRLKYVEHYHNEINTGDEVNRVFYSYWFDNWPTILGFYRKKNRNFNFISRAHGFEIFEEQRQGKFFPFRNLQLKEIAKVYSVSKKGQETLKKKNPSYHNKIKHCNIGSNDYGTGPYRKQEEFVLVSCARISSIKRVHLIAEMLEHIDFKIRWVHFGCTYEGEEVAGEKVSKQVEILKKKSNITIELMGNRTNDEIMEYYKSHMVNAFISLSSTEGIPVTMMEAISFGIPLISTDVGGCAEITTAQTGVLVKKEESPENVAEVLKQFKNSEKNTKEFREGVRKFWEDNFDLRKNIDTFLQEIEPVFN